MVRQARERLGAHHVRRAGLDKLHHLGGEQPPLAHRVAQREDLARIFGQLVDVRRRVEARRLGERLVHRCAELLDGGKRHLRPERTLRAAPERIFLEDAARNAEQEELDEPRHHGLAPFPLDHVDDLVVRRGVKLHEDFAHHADARFGSLALERQRIEVLDNLTDRALEAAVRLAGFQLALACGHPVVEQAIRATGFHLVGARAIEALHEHVAVLQRVHGLEQHLRRDLEARVVLA